MVLEKRYGSRSHGGVGLELRLGRAGAHAQSSVPARWRRCQGNVVEAECPAPSGSDKPKGVPARTKGAAVHFRKWPRKQSAPLSILPEKRGERPPVSGQAPRWSGSRTSREFVVQLERHHGCKSGNHLCRHQRMTARSSKKLSWMPVRSTPSTSRQMPASVCSVGVCGATNSVSVSKTGAGNAFRSTLPFGVVSGSDSRKQAPTAPYNLAVSVEGTCAVHSETFSLPAVGHHAGQQAGCRRNDPPGPPPTSPERRDAGSTPARLHPVRGDCHVSWPGGPCDPEIQSGRPAATGQDRRGLLYMRALEFPSKGLWTNFSPVKSGRPR